jgi:Tol biopolymer transport system component
MPRNITGNKGYDNQPFFRPDGVVLFTSMRDGKQTDIYSYDPASGRIAQLTDTAESEYSPTVTPDGGISVIRVEPDGTQRLWRFSAQGKDPKLVLTDVKPVGYHAWSGDHTLALFVLGQPATLQVADTRSGAARVLAQDIGRSLQQIPGTTHISFVQRIKSDESTTLMIKELDPGSGTTADLTMAVPGSAEADLAWAPDGSLFMAKSDHLFTWKRGGGGWAESADLTRMSLAGVTRLAISSDGRQLAIVARP